MKIGFIGCGNMAKAMISGIIKSQILCPKDIVASDTFLPALEKAKQEMGILIETDNTELAQKCEIIVLAVKPHFYQAVISQIRDFVSENTIIITIAPGKTLEFIGQNFGKNIKIVRTMPNTPAMVGQGMTAVCKNEFVTQDEIQYILSLLCSFGKASLVAENMMDAVVAVSGSSPAYVYMFIEALADGAVMQGMPRDLAYEFAAQAVLGSAKMLMETSMHPGALKDMVCSPAGTTIEAVRVLEEKGFRSSVMEAMKACAEKSKGM